MLEGEDILFIGMNAWDDIIQRPQHIARGLAGNNRVLVIDPTQYSFLTKLRGFLSKENQSRGWLPTLRYIHESLLVFTPPPMLPFSLGQPILNAFNCRAVYYLLKPTLRAIAFKPSLLWLTFPPGLPYLTLFNPLVSCFDCLDNYPEFFPDHRGRRLAKQEKALLGRIDLVFATSPLLAEKCKPYSTDVHLVPNAVSPCFLEQAVRACPADLQAIPKPIVGYIGYISHWFDFELITYLAKERPQWSFVMVGPRDEGGSYKEIRNCHFLGTRGHEEIPAYIDHFDACLIPFKVNELTDSVNPVKLYEYLARGKPVIAANTQEMRHFSPVCYLADSKEDFLKKIDKALQEKGAQKKGNIRARQAWAKENTWSQRLASISTLVEAHLRKKRCPS